MIRTKIDTEGLNELSDKLDNLNGGMEISTDDLMTDTFIQNNTEFHTWQQMLDNGGVKTDDDILSEQFSDFVAAHSGFDSFNEMLNEAAAEYLADHLGS